MTEIQFLLRFINVTLTLNINLVYLIKKYKIMKRRFFISFCVLLTMKTFSQVGINVTNPKATLDVVGKPTESSILDGFIAPRITAPQLKVKVYTIDQKGALIYVTEKFSNDSDATGQTKLVKSIGFYEFDGVNWIPIRSLETLYDVVERGNYAGRFISFTGDSTTKQGTREGALGVNSTTNSYFWGNMNPGQTGQNNLGIGLNALKNISSGRLTVAIGNNAFQGSTGNLNFNTGIGANVASLYMGDSTVALGYNTLNSNWKGTQNTAIGQNAMSEGTGNGDVSYNTVVGSNALRLAVEPFGNIMIGRSTGAYMSGKNNIFIGNMVGIRDNNTGVPYSGNNKLAIHNNSIDSNGDATNSKVENSLIYGDFDDPTRMVRINGRFEINPIYYQNLQEDNSLKTLLFNYSTGEVRPSVLNHIAVPATPATGTYVLKSVNGVMTWVVN